MIASFYRLMSRLAGWLAPDSRRPPFSLSSGSTVGFNSLVNPRSRPATATELLGELKATAWACASLNAAACASFPPRLYVTTRPGQPASRCATQPLSAVQHKRLSRLPSLNARLKGAQRIEEVTEHPLLTLLQKVNPIHNAFDLWELTTLYQEVVGSAYWLLDFDSTLGVPAAIWPLPAQRVRPQRATDSNQVVDAYFYRGGAEEVKLSPEEVIAFRYPDPADPYLGGLSPLRACLDQVRLASALASFKLARFDNHAIPDALVCPEQVIGEEERDRLETLWNQKLRRGGAGRVIVAESNMRVQLLAHSMGDLAALADLRATREDIANAFHVPISYLTSETNLANLQAAETQHAKSALRPRLQRRDEKLNEQLVPLFDPSGRLFLLSDEPVPADRRQAVREHELYLQQGVITVNEVRSELGLTPVAWGDQPFRSSH